ncbi:MAG: bifunctional 5,10-methylenetetrahydrofolate dehydrogenase/5,10-methenyltetrahydrofolate cyclohydrolase [Holophagaceae bacterium]|jgi:5,10-methylene-tetrahydrofolate dehydrogenase/methenyl tetrahydrofolate cyclohydrolase|uniref:Bifunctional 5,10-methylenetetrahydrofolate dehydrogenase/5,10-methenyltetrahydrofolate cyclohydrolase n=1 Tax=Candidatus Geothrix odensensis TaxID=2954440 RepID=A0A936F1N7_9BACT|nr:bifunctional 5,10-methylenetetrahydrofolate dehydrogenase/5,10-methenyltetrahydrofolate cyclohydrolase [Candidatus Geothrix odensensis]MBK8789730.1 bifunctional 5,10-methylenetetrahydrofolate dehydrogenase/5,10-methenyltetrahydrofolate cyclohydrolase [Holophagaceae bacterium]
MPTTLTGRLDCQETARHYFELVRSNVKKLGFSPGLAIVLGSQDTGSLTYQRWLMKDCENAGINASDLRVENGMQLVKLVARLNQDEKTHGVFIFYPLRYQEIKDDEVMDLVDPGKDIEGLHAINIGFLNKYRKRMDDGTQHRCMTPCTARAIVKTLKRGFGEAWLAGKTVLVINDSLRIGRPLTAMVANLKATPILCHANTNPAHLEGFIRMADVIVSAVPAPGYQINTDWIKDGALCFDLSGEGNFDYEALTRRGIPYTDTTKNSVGKVTRAMALLNLTYAAGLE